MLPSFMMSYNRGKTLVWIIHSVQFLVGTMMSEPYKEFTSIVIA